MRFLPYFAIATFIAGVAMLIVGYAYSDGGKVKSEPVTFFTSVPETSTAAAPTDTAATEAPSPTPTPAPYDGQLMRLKIPRFAVDAAIEAIGVKPNNELDTPHDPHNVGWYDTTLDKNGPYIGAKPGFGKNAVLSAHVDYYGLPASATPFNKLKNTDPKDEIDIVMANGEQYRYQIISKQRFSVSEIKMGELIEAKDKPAGKEWITLITCGNDGAFVYVNPGATSGPVEYLTRDVVIAERVQ
jgi:hypothetical protein